MGFRRQLFIGYSVSLAVAAAATSLAVGALRASANDETRVARQFTDELLAVERFRFSAEHVIASARASTGAGATERLGAAMQAMEARAADVRDASLSTESARDVQMVVSEAREYAASDGPAPAVRQRLEKHLQLLAARERGSFEQALARARHRASSAGLFVGLIGGIGLALSAVLAALVIRRLAREHTMQREATSAARREADAREELLEIVSHDLRNPLTTITFAVDLLAARPTEADTVRHLAKIRFATERMKHLVEEIVDNARLDAGQLGLDVRRCDLLGLLRAAVAQFADAAAKLRVSLRYESELDHAMVRADGERLARVLSNLIGNALKFTPAGGAVIVRAEATADAIVVVVEDTGPGIDPGELEHVFDRYWRGGRASGTHGLGLGLYICRRLVEAHGGRIWVVSEPAHGTRFHFSLPRAFVPPSGDFPDGTHDRSDDR